MPAFSEIRLPRPAVEILRVDEAGRRSARTATDGWRRAASSPALSRIAARMRAAKSDDSTASTGRSRRRRQFGCSSIVPGRLACSSSSARSSSCRAARQDRVRARRGAASPSGARQGHRNRPTAPGHAACRRAALYPAPGSRARPAGRQPPRDVAEPLAPSDVVRREEAAHRRQVMRRDRGKRLGGIAVGRQEARVGPVALEPDDPIAEEAGRAHAGEIRRARCPGPRRSRCTSRVPTPRPPPAAAGGTGSGHRRRPLPPRRAGSGSASGPGHGRCGPRRHGTSPPAASRARRPRRWPRAQAARGDDVPVLPQRPQRIGRGPTQAPVTSASGFAQASAPSGTTPGEIAVRTDAHAGRSSAPVGRRELTIGEPLQEGALGRSARSCAKRWTARRPATACRPASRGRARVGGRGAPPPRQAPGSGRTAPGPNRPVAPLPERVAERGLFATAQMQLAEAIPQLLEGRGAWSSRRPASRSR